MAFAEAGRLTHDGTAVARPHFAAFADRKPMLQAGDLDHQAEHADHATIELMTLNLIDFLDRALNGCPQPRAPSTFQGKLANLRAQYGSSGLSICKTDWQFNEWR